MVTSRGVKKNFFDTELSCLVVKNAKIEKKSFLCSFNDQFKQIFLIITEKLIITNYY